MNKGKRRCRSLLSFLAAPAVEAVGVPPKTHLVEQQPPLAVNSHYVLAVDFRIILASATINDVARGLSVVGGETPVLPPLYGACYDMSGLCGGQEEAGAVANQVNNGKKKGQGYRCPRPFF